MLAGDLHPAKYRSRPANSFEVWQCQHCAWCGSKRTLKICRACEQRAMNKPLCSPSSSVPSPYVLWEFHKNVTTSNFGAVYEMSCFVAVYYVATMDREHMKLSMRRGALLTGCIYIFFYNALYLSVAATFSDLYLFSLWYILSKYIILYLVSSQCRTLPKGYALYFCIFCCYCCKVESLMSNLYIEKGLYTKRELSFFSGQDWFAGL